MRYRFLFALLTGTLALACGDDDASEVPADDGGIVVDATAGDAMPPLADAGPGADSGVAGCPGEACRARWSRSIFGFNGSVRSLAIHPDGGVLAGGQTGALCCASVRRVGAAGDATTEWTLEEASQGVEALAVGPDGSAYVIVRISERVTVAGTEAAEGEAMVVALDASLAPRWARTVPGEAAAVALDGGSVYVGGSFEGSATLGGEVVDAPQALAYVVAFDEDGAEGWNVRFPAAARGTVVDALDATGSGIVVTGYGGPVVLGPRTLDEAWMVELAPDGAVRGGTSVDGLEMTFDWSWPVTVERVVPRDDGRFMAAMQFRAEIDMGGGTRTSGSWASALAFYGADWAYESDVAFTGSHTDFVHAVHRMPDGAVVIGGTVTGQSVDFGFGRITPADPDDRQGYVRIYDRTGGIVDQVALTADYSVDVRAVAADDSLIYVSASRPAFIDDVAFDDTSRFDLMAITRR